MKTSKITSAAALMIGAVLFAGCHSVRRGEPIASPMKLDEKQKRGRIVFLQRCHQCHPNGEAGLGPALNNKPAPVFLMKTQVRVGLGAMPRFDKHAIADDELDALMSYVMALRKADVEEAKDSKKEKKEESKPEKEKPAAKTPDRRPSKI